MRFIHAIFLPRIYICLHLATVLIVTFLKFSILYLAARNLVTNMTA